eukprot:TRINITY_DN1362_c1_g5_i1.p1 TRINITY_DN1362_c1_g5~~TRINITY_DN1362_c1_g5_i1.p1  ORF type:complete len:347 (+),score=48.23 TRINITY_DN1362_c1_g5_i1:57-1097(+)
MTEELQAAIDALPATGGELVLVPGRTYTLGGTVVLDRRVNVTIRGDRSAVVRGTRDDTPAFQIVGCRGVRLVGFTVVKGNVLLIESSHCELVGLEVISTDGSSLLLDGQTGAGSSYNTVKDCNVSTSGRVGISQNCVKHSQILNNTCQQNGYEGLTIDNHSDYCMVKGNRFEGNAGGVGQVGIDCSTGCIISGNMIIGRGSTAGKGLTTSGITFQNNIGCTDKNIVTNNVITSNGEWGVHLRTGVNSSGCNMNVISNNQLHGNRRGPCKIDSTASFGNVLSSNCFGSQPLADNGANTVVSADVQQSDAALLGSSYASRHDHVVIRFLTFLAAVVVAVVVFHVGYRV